MDIDAAANRLVDVALSRAKAAETIGELGGKPGSGAGSRAGDLARLQERVEEADAEISATSHELLDLRAKVVRISIDTDARRADDCPVETARLYQFLGPGL